MNVSKMYYTISYISIKKNKITNMNLRASWRTGATRKLGSEFFRPGRTPWGMGSLSDLRYPTSIQVESLKRFILFFFCFLQLFLLLSSPCTLSVCLLPSLPPTLSTPLSSFSLLFSSSSFFLEIEAALPARVEQLCTDGHTGHDYSEAYLLSLTN